MKLATVLRSLAFAAAAGWLALSPPAHAAAPPAAATAATHLTAPTQYVDAAGVKLAYRRFGKQGGVPRAGADAYLQQIRQPVLVVSGSRDLVHYTANSFTLQQRLPNAQLIVYPDSNHGSIYQYPALFLKQASLFLNQP